MLKLRIWKEEPTVIWRSLQGHFSSSLINWKLVLLALVLNYGVCDDPKSPEGYSPSSSLRSSSSTSEVINSDYNRHLHSSTLGSSSSWLVKHTKDSNLPWDQPNIVPLTLQEQEIRQKQTKGKSSRRVKNEQGSTEGSRNKGKGKKEVLRELESKPTLVITQSTGQQHPSVEKSKSDETARSSSSSLPNSHQQPQSTTPFQPPDMVLVRKKALEFGKQALEFFARGMTFSPTPEEGHNNGESRSSKIFFESAQAEPRQEGGAAGGEGNRNRVIDWVARLIGVQGKTLGEFLREYQVHVLYDLVFTFFKWIFFLYAGLLIP